MAKQYSDLPATEGLFDIADNEKLPASPLGAASTSNDPATVLENDATSPLAAVSKPAVTGDSPLSQRLFQESDELHPDRSEVLAKRDAIMEAYKKLMAAQAYQAPVDDTATLAMVTPTLMNSPSTAAFGQGLIESTKQDLKNQAAQQAAGVNQAATGLAGATTNEGFDAKDLDSQLKLLQAAALNDYRGNQLAAKDSTVIKDPNTGRVIGTYNKVTQQMEPIGGSAGATGGPAQIVPVPGVAPNSPIHAGMNDVLNSQGLDPAGMMNRTKPDVAASAADSKADKASLDAALNAASIAAKAQKAIEEGYAGGGAGNVASNIAANLGLSPQLVTNKNLIDKYSGGIAASLASSLHGARIGVGMEKFLKGTTFNTDISPAANLDIVKNIQDLPAVAKTNMTLGNLTAQLPQSYKNAVYTEFTTDNPPFVPNPNGVPDPKTKELPTIVNPVYKDPQLVQKWFAQRGQKAQGAEAAPAAGTPAPSAPAQTQASAPTAPSAAPPGVASPTTTKEYDDLDHGTPYWNPHTKSVKTKP